MPNWCENRIKISGPTKKINKLWEDINNDGLLNTLHPQPDNLFLENLDPEKRLELDKDGVPNWYDWRVENWGTKWEISSEDLCLLDNSDGTSCVWGDFVSAWSPPIEAYTTFNKMNNDCEIEGWYFELGCGFCGLYSSKDRDLYCNDIYSELKLPEAEQSEALKRTEYEFGDSFAVEEQDDE